MTGSAGAWAGLFIFAILPVALRYDVPMAEPVPVLAPQPHAPVAAVPFLGRRIVLVAAVCQALGFGLLGVLSFVNTPLTQEFGASQFQIGLGFSFSILSPAFCGPLLGWLLDRGPLRTIMLLGLLVMLVGVSLIARGESLAQLAAGFAVVTVGMSMYGLFPAHVMIVNWFVVGRGWALALAAVGISVSAFAVPQIASRAVEALGWRGAVLAIGLGAAAIAGPLIAALARKRPEEVGQHPDGLPPIAHDPAKLVEIPFGTLLRQRNFWLVGLGTGLGLCSSIPGFYLIRHMEIEFGVSAIEAASVPSLMAVGGLTGKLAAGWAADRLDKRSVVLTSLVLHAIGWILALTQSSLTGMLLAALPMGLGSGSFLPLVPMLQGACFGRAMIGRVSGLHAALGLPILIGIAPGVGWLQHQTGSFTVPFLGLAGVCVLAALVLAFVRIPGREPGR